MRKNNHLNLLNRLLEQHLIEEETILSQHTKRKTQRAVRVVEGYNPDDILALLEKKLKQYDVYAYLLEEHHRNVFLKELEDMGFSKSSIDGLVKKVSLKNMMQKLNEILLQIVSLKRRKRTLTCSK